MHNFKKLRIWKESMALVHESYKITRLFPDYEKFGLVVQMNKCAVSIPSNISEGTSKSTDRHFNKFLEDSLGSAFEWETQLIVAYNEKYISKEQFNCLSDQIIKIQKMISRFQSGLNI